MLIGNKADLTAERAVKKEEGVQVAKVSVSILVLGPSLSLHSHLSLTQSHLLEFDHSVFGSHWYYIVGECGM